MPPFAGCGTSLTGTNLNRDNLTACHPHGHPGDRRRCWRQCKPRRPSSGLDGRPVLQLEERDAAWLRVPQPCCHMSSTATYLVLVTMSLPSTSGATTQEGQLTVSSRTPGLSTQMRSEGPMPSRRSHRSNSQHLGVTLPTSIQHEVALRSGGIRSR